MCPHIKVNGESDYGSEKNVNANQIIDLKTQLDNKRRKVKFRDDGMVERRNITNDMDKISDMINAREVPDNNIYEDEVRKFVR